MNCVDELRFSSAAHVRQALESILQIRHKLYKWCESAYRIISQFEEMKTCTSQSHSKCNNDEKETKNAYWAQD